MKISTRLRFSLLVVLASQGSADYCKWVDENGVAHYAETCPEEVVSTEIELQTPPTQEQVVEAMSRSAQSAEKRKTDKEKAIEEQPVFRPRYSGAEIKKMEKERQEKQCEAWRTELAELERKRAWHEIQIDLKKLLNENNCK